MKSRRNKTNTGNKNMWKIFIFIIYHQLVIIAFLPIFLLLVYE